MKNPVPVQVSIGKSEFRFGSAQALWLQGLILLTFLAASSVPSPLYSVYRASWGFSPLALTVVFGSYALALLLALLVFGALSDYRGRREVVLGALVLEIVSMLLFWNADSVGWLLAARILQGAATGIATSALSAGLVDLHRERGSLINSIAPMIGLGVGGLGASILVQFAPAPTRLVFELLLAAFALQLLLAFFLPETARPRPGALRSLRPSIDIPHTARSTLLRVLPVNTAQWALGGLYLSLGPTLATSVTGNDAPVVGGVMIAALTFSSAATIAFTRSVTPSTAAAAGAAGLASGVLLTLVGVHWDWPVFALAGTIIAGAGFGAAFSGSVRSLIPLAQPHERAGLMAAFFVASYLAFSVPPVVAGLLTSRFGLEATAIGYGLAAACLALVAAFAIPARRPA
jgi:MFS family permease